MLHSLTKIRRHTQQIRASALQLTVFCISRIHCNPCFEWKSHSSGEVLVEAYSTDKTTENLYKVTERSARNESWDNTMQYPLVPASLQHYLLQRSLQLGALLCTLTEINSMALHATLSLWIVSREVTIPFEVRLNFNNDFSESKTLPHDPAKKSYSFYSVIEVHYRASLSSCRASGFGDSLKQMFLLCLAIFFHSPILPPGLGVNTEQVHAMDLMAAFQTLLIPTDCLER